MAQFQRTMAQFILLFFFASFYVTVVKLHPQCLDSGPPFTTKPPSTFCRFKQKRASLGCCTAKQTSSLKVLIKKALQKVKHKRRCRTILKKVICLQCHSWSAHIYEAESNTGFHKDTARPCLMPWFCARFTRHCKGAIKVIWGRQMNAWNISLPNLCSKLYNRINDDYCYPKIQRTITKLDNPIQYRLNSTIASQRKKRCLCVKKIISGLRSPLALVHANDKTNRMFVLEQVGVIYIIYKNGTKLKQPFLNITHKVLTTPASGDERGLLGIVFHPEYSETGRVFIYYSTYGGKATKKTGLGEQWWLGISGDTVLSEFHVSKNDSNVLDPNSERVLMRFKQPMPNHNGGQLLFGLDKMLYIFPGDGGGAGDPFGKYGNALNMSSLLGKVLRINIDNNSSAPYGIPADNPFVNDPNAHPEIYAYGARNMWRCSVDRGSRTGQGKGRIFCGDVGQEKYEEIDIIVKGGNYGWRGREGFKCFDKDLCNGNPLLDNEILPIWAYDHNEGKSVVGGYVYRGCEYPRMRRYYFCADTMTGRIWSLKHHAGSNKWYPKSVCMGDDAYCNGPNVSGIYAKNIYSFGEDEAGELYILSTAIQNTDEAKGSVYQLIDPERRTDPTLCK